MEVTDVIGNFGKFQLIMIAVLTVRSFSASFNYLTYQFVSFELDYHCTEDSFVNSSFVESSSKCFQSKVETSSNGILINSTVACNEWDFAYNAHSTIVQEWNLVCDQSYIISMGYLALVLGNFVAYIPSGHFSDRYGRWPLVFWGQAWVTIWSFVIIFSNSILMFLALRILIGMGYGSIQNAILSAFLECLGPKHRDLFSIVFTGTFGLAMMVFGGVCFFLTDWRYKLIVAFFPIQPIFLATIWWFFPESTRWLLVTKQNDKAELQIIRQARMNGKTVEEPKEVVKKLIRKIEEDESRERPSFLDVFRNRFLRKSALILYLTFAMLSFTYHGFIITIGRLDGSIFINIIWSGLMEILSVIIFFISVKFFDRRKGLITCFCLAGVSFLLSLAVPNDVKWAKIALAMFGYFCNSLAYTVIYLFASEIFPTNLRVVALSGAMSCGRLGAMVSPFMDLVGRAYGQYATFTIYGVLSILTSVVFYFLPETKNKSLPDTVTESEKLEMTLEGF